jgi:RHS repeat-associated protein
LDAVTGPDGKVSLNVVDPHGDVAATVPVASSGDACGISGWAGYDEYGTRTVGSPVDTGAVSYAWAGAAQRAMTGAGLVLMGARLYDPVTGRFTSPDPVTGGNENAYNYPNDPINQSDFTGQYTFRQFWRGVARVGRAITDSKIGRFAQKACAFAWGAVAAVCGGVFTAAYAAQGRWKDAAVSAISTAAGFAGGRLVAGALLRHGGQSIKRVTRTRRFLRNVTGWRVNPKTIVTSGRRRQWAGGYAASQAAAYLGNSYIPRSWNRPRW